jgi:hypothetical protein
MWLLLLLHPRLVGPLQVWNRLWRQLLLGLLLGRRQCLLGLGDLLLGQWLLLLLCCLVSVCCQQAHEACNRLVHRRRWCASRKGTSQTMSKVCRQAWYCHLQEGVDGGRWGADRSEEIDVYVYAQATSHKATSWGPCTGCRAANLLQS